MIAFKSFLSGLNSSKRSFHLIKNIKRNSSLLRTIDASPVLVSSNHDIYTNLALEHWLYNNLRFTCDQQKINSSQIDNSNKNSHHDAIKLYNRPVVFIWTDEPSVVIGRHQNPWVEATLGFVNKAKIKLARRHSGGGCVYHDENNINISIIGHRKLFENRQKNLKFLAQTLDKCYGIKCEPTQRHDLVHIDSRMKLSGSAAKLGKFNSYHHFTLLVDTNTEALYTSIRQNQQEFIKTNSSLSTKSKVINLKEIKSDLNVNQVICDLANAYNTLYHDPKSKKTSREDNFVADEADYQELKKYREELESWDWIFGKTPKFKLEKSLPIIDGGVEKQVKFSVQINKALFETIEIDCDLVAGNPVANFQHLIGTKFNYHDAMVNVAKLLQIDEANLVNTQISVGMEKLFATFLLQMIHESNY